ncbi:MAG: NUDIX hydrolase, partial [Planctomycetota bacterium]
MVYAGAEKVKGHVPTLPGIRSALAAREPGPIRPFSPGRGHAAVALALAGPDDALSLCFLRRAVRGADRWSGQVAFPGGGSESGDASALAAAIRETREEVGLSLSGRECLGALPDVLVRGEPPVAISPYVFHAGDPPPPLGTSAEAPAAFWVPLAHLWSPENRATLD